MMEPATAPIPAGHLFHSALFLPPGRPRPLARRLAIHNRVVRRIRSYLEENRFQEVPPLVSPGDGLEQLDAMIAKGFPAVWGESQRSVTGPADGLTTLSSYKVVEAVAVDLDPSGLADLMEGLLKAVAGDLGADILGGRAVTRLDRMLAKNHPRLEFAAAREILGERGWDPGPEGRLEPEAAASLVRYCGDLPVLLCGRPGRAGADLMIDGRGRPERVTYILPFAGETMDGGLRRGEPLRAGFGLGVARLLQFLMGLGAVSDAVIDPGAGRGIAV